MKLGFMNVPPYILVFVIGFVTSIVGAVIPVQTENAYIIIMIVIGKGAILVWGFVLMIYGSLLWVIERNKCERKRN